MKLWLKPKGSETAFCPSAEADGNEGIAAGDKAIADTNPTPIAPHLNNQTTWPNKLLT